VSTYLTGGPPQVITGEQIKAARKLLGWTPFRLAPRAGMGHTLLRQFEDGARPSAARLRAALEAEGVEFLANGSCESVRLRHSNGAAVGFREGRRAGLPKVKKQDLSYQGPGGD
jgi:transcriptional regulator with XRE-family HTH domain